MQEWELLTRGEGGGGGWQRLFTTNNKYLCSKKCDNRGLPQNLLWGGKPKNWLRNFQGGHMLGTPPPPPQIFFLKPKRSKKKKTDEGVIPANIFLQVRFFGRG